MPNENKIAGGLSNASEILGDRSPIRAYTADGKFWLISQKYADQPSIKWGHDTPLLGGNVVGFDVHTKTWSAPVKFEPISQDEQLEGLAFGCKNSLLLLTFTKNPFSYGNLYEWKDNRWHKFDQLHVDETLKGGQGDVHTSLVVPDGEVYLVQDSGYSAHVAKLNVQNGKASIDKVVASPMVYPKERMPCSPHFVATAVLDDKLYAFYGQQTCGFHWDPCRLLIVNLKDGSTEIATVAKGVVGGDEGDDLPPPPPWGFSGPSDHFLYPSMRRWMFLGGSLAVGMSGTKADGSMWQFDLNSRGWIPHGSNRVPEGASLFGVTGGNHGGVPPMVYMVNPSEGVYEIHPESTS